jgi:hypothetical protein
MNDDLPIWVEHLLLRCPFRAAEDGYVAHRHFHLQRFTLAAADAHENGRVILRHTCLTELESVDERRVQAALAYLFVVGMSSDAKSVEALTQHQNEGIQKSARTCIFELTHKAQ